MRTLRLAADLSQEELAARAALGDSAYTAAYTTGYALEFTAVVAETAARAG